MIHQCNIEWNNLSLTNWHNHFTTIEHSTLLQDYDYARALSPVYHQKPSWGLIKIDQQPAGLVQIMEASILGKAIQAITLDRGPLWLPGYGHLAHFEAFLKCFAHQYPARWGRKRRFIPETKSSPQTITLLEQYGFKKQSNQSYHTLWLDLTPDEETLRKNQAKNWRGSLKKAETSPLSIEWDETGKNLEYVLQQYAIDKTRKSYKGADLGTLKPLSALFFQNQKALIGLAKLENKPVAAILILCHGKSATYQLGWSTEHGRKYCAHHLLLWQSLGKLKARHISSFDLGGFNDTSAANLKRFKSGMGALPIELPGIYN